MKQVCFALALVALLSSPFSASAEEAKVSPATNLKEPYPAADGFLPAEPMPPEKGVKDYENFLKYVDAVNAYIKAAQTYIDNATNDANTIITKRNDAAQKAQHVIDTYNNSLPKDEKKS